MAKANTKTILRVESPKTKAIKWMQTGFALLIGFVFLFPLVWLFAFSFKGNNEILSVSFFPQYPTLEPWLAQLNSPDFLQWLKNSFLIAFISMSITFLLGVMAAYGIARFQFPCKTAIILILLVTQMMPASLLLTPLFLTYSKLGMLNTYMAPAFAVAAGSIPFAVITLRPYFMAVPKSLEDAARIDGCNAFTSFIRIIIPIVRTGLITILVISFLHGWNDLVYSMTFNVSEAMRPLTANIFKFMDKYGLRWNAIMAYGMILVTPVTLAFVFLQKYIVGGITSGAVKE